MTIRCRRLPLLSTIVVLCLVITGCSGTDSPLADRPYEVHVPPGYDEATPAPLLIVLHGYALEAKVQSLYFGLDAVTDPRGILYVAPEGTKNAEGKTFWNATTACCAPPDSDVDDSAYLAAVIAAVRKDYAVDDRRIFVLGHSNGGFMAYRLACDHADLIAGIVSLEGAMNEDSSACDPSEPVSVVEIHGTADTVIRYEGGRNDDADPNAPAYPSAAQSVLEWAKFDGCDDRTAAEKLVGLYVGVPRHELPATEDGEYYWGDLIGLDVVNVEGERLGRIDRLLETGADSVLVVVDDSASADKPVERLIPFVSAVVKDVDRDAAVVRVEWGAQW